MKKNHPVLKLPKTVYEKLIDIFSLIIIVLNLIYLINEWSTLPDQVPIHFNAKGEADGWGGRAVIWFLPIVSIFLWSILTTLERVPYIFNFPVKVTEQNAERLYKNAQVMSVILKAEIIVFLFYTSWKSVQVSVGREVGLGILELPIFLVVLLGTIAFFRVRSFLKVK
ncbi:DUF1648 domain-containing protein [Peribacillus butanolivorans]|uniref:DUF1648 domain-containing protein n=1 Tax=Peribacillus butanolivorans TaxID=421767 RepID=UPI00207D2DA4|nr:DUF1648 domain-containing protein [Peribacillus butanolivorans]MCO0599105.1 DUF1648 domain-containing protein [Peribacillus butanolivorans]